MTRIKSKKGMYICFLLRYVEGIRVFMFFMFSFSYFYYYYCTDHERSLPNNCKICSAKLKVKKL